MEHITNTIDDKDRLIDLPLELIDFDPNQDRQLLDIESEEFLEFVETIRLEGVRRPIEVKENESGRYALIAGERRCRAAMVLGIKTIPALKRVGITDEQSSFDMLTENLSRSNLKPMDQARALKSRMEMFNMTSEQIGKRIGKSSSWVRTALMVLNMGPLTQAVSNEGLVTGINRLSRLNELERNNPAQFDQVISQIRDGTAFDEAIERLQNTRAEDTTNFNGATGTTVSSGDTPEKKAVRFTVTDDVMSRLMDKAFRVPNGTYDINNYDSEKAYKAAVLKRLEKMMNRKSS